MTKGSTSKPKMLGRLIFGDKRKQHASPSRHRSTTRPVGNVSDVLPSNGNATITTNKNPINVHEWAVWRTQLNEQMGNGITDENDLKPLKQFLQTNSFYQQHSRDPSNGRYNGVRLLFSIPHAKLKSELRDGPRRKINNNNTIRDAEEIIIVDQNQVQPTMDNRIVTNVNSIPTGSSVLMDKTMSQLLPKTLIGNTGGFLPINEEMVATDLTQTRRSMRATYIASDRIHSTLQKAVKDGNVLEKIKAFEMQAAAAQAMSTPKLGGGGIHNSITNRMQSVTSNIQLTAQRALSPVVVHPISPMPIRYELQPQMYHQQQLQQYIRSPPSRRVHPVQQHRRDGNIGPGMGRESRKGAHVLEPAHGDVILKRRTPSQRTVNDDDYSMTLISSMAPTISQGHHHHRQQQQHHRRASASRSRHRQEKSNHDKRSSSHHDHVHKKHQSKQNDTSIASTKSSTCRRWLRGRKETSNEAADDKDKEDLSTSKSKKNKKNKKKNHEKEKVTSTDSKNKKSSTSDNNRVYGVPNTAMNEPSKSEIISPPPRIEEENESDHEEVEIKPNQTFPKEQEEQEEITQPTTECITIVPTNVEKRLNKSKHHQKLSSTDGDILSKAEDDTRFSRPTDDHAHRSDLIDEDDECKSEGDVFIDESSGINLQPLQPATNVIRRFSSQCSVEEFLSNRRWQWSKESGGLIERTNSKRKAQPITVLTRKNENPQTEQLQNSTLKKQQSSHTSINNELNNSKHILHEIINTKNSSQEPSPPPTNEYLQPNPEETFVNKTTV